MKNKLSYFIENYGCQMNVSDSELVSSLLTEAGYKQADIISCADVIIFNTCSVREHAEARVLGRISNEISRKLLNPDLIIGVIGCMAQRIGEKLFSINNKIDFVAGVDNYRQIPNMINSIVVNESKLAFDTFDEKELYDDISPMRKSEFNAFISVMRGCNNYCSYCIVPYVRGRERSRPVDSILDEIYKAGIEGYKDITLLGQNVNSYNYKGIDFADLLNRANNIDTIERLRFVTSHPKDLSDRLIQSMASNSKVCENLHLPLQSADNDILTAMNRGYTIEHYLNVVNKLRQAIPEISLTTDIIVGFPDETEKQYMATVNAMKEIQFDSAFMFKYSVREGTAAAKMNDNIPESEKLFRLDAVINLQTEITFGKYHQQVGNTVEVLVEKVSKKSKTELAGKTRDFKIAVFPGEKHLIGKMVKLKIVDAVGWTLKGELQ